MKTQATVIILTCDSYTKKFGCIEHVIASVLNQIEIDIEIIVIDNGSSYNDSARLLKYIDTLNSSYLRVEKCHRSIASARNLGASRASSDLLIFLDEDTILLDSRTLAKIYDKSLFKVYGYGAEREWTEKDWFDINHEEVLSDIKSNDYSLLKANIGKPDPAVRKKSTDKYLTRSFIGNFGFFHKDLFSSLGGFPEQFLGYGLEDDTLSFLAYLEYGAPSILSEITVVHVTHPIGNVQFSEYEENLRLYSLIIKSYGYKYFHIGDLLYPEKKTNRPVLE